MLQHGCQRLDRAIGCALFAAALLGAQTPQARQAKPVYLIAFQGAAQPGGFGDLAAFATTTLRLRLSSLKTLRYLTSQSELPCRQSAVEGSRASGESTGDSAGVPKHYILSGIVDIHDQDAGDREINLLYSLDAVERCQVKNLLQSRVPMAPAEALARFRSMGDVVASRLEAELSDRALVIVEPVITTATDEQTRGSAKLLEQLLEHRLADSEDFQAARDSASRTRAGYRLTARLETKPIRRGSRVDGISFRVTAGSKHYDLPRESAPTGQDRGALLEFLGDAADSVLQSLAEIRFRSESGLPDDPALVETSLAVAKAEQYLAQGQARAALALLSGLPADRPLSPEVLGVKGQALFETADYRAAADAYDKAAAGSREPLIQARLLYGAAASWYRAREYPDAAERYATLLPLARQAASSGADARKMIRESVRWRMASLGLSGKPEQALEEYINLRPEVDDPAGVEDEAAELLGGISSLPALRRMTELIASRLGSDSPVLQRGWQRLGDDLFARRDLEKARQCYLNALAGARKHAPLERRQIASLLNLVGNSYFDSTMTKDAIRYYDEAIKEASGGGPSLAADLLVYLRNLSVAYQVEGDPGKAEDQLKEAVKTARTAYGTGAPEAALVDIQLGSLYTERGKFADAEPLLLRAAAVLEKQSPRDDQNLAWAYKQTGWLRWEMGRAREAEEFFLKAKGIFDTLGQTSTATYGWILANLGSTYVRFGDYAKAVASQRRALEIIAKSGSPDDVGRSRHNLCVNLTDYQAYTEAAAECEKVRSTYQRLYGPEHWMYGYTTLAMVSIRAAQAQFPAAERLQDEGYRIYSASEAAEHWRLLSIRSGVGRLRYCEGRYSEAQTVLEETLSAQIKEHGSSDSRVADTQNTLGWTYFRIERYPESQAAFATAVASFDASGFPDHPIAASSREGMGRLALVRGDLAGADALCNRSLAGRLKSFGYDSEAVADSLDCVGLVSTARREFAAATAHFQRALAAYEAAFGQQHPKIAETLDHLAALQRAAGNNTEAARLADRAAAIHRAFRMP